MTPQAPRDFADFTDFAEHLLDLACVASTEGRFLWLSKGWTEALGWCEGHLLATPFIDFVHPDDVESTVAEVATLSQGIPTVRFVNRYRTADGSWRWLEWTTSPRDEVLYCVVRDITRAKEQEALNERRMRLLEMSLELSNAGYWRVDFAREQVEWSPEVYAIHGLDPATFTPTLETGIDAYHPDDRQHVTDAISKSTADKVPFWFELRLIRPNGEERRVESVGRPELDAKGNVTGLFGIFRDITDDPAALRREELEQFAYVASHDLREPARTIASFVDLLRDEVSFEPQHAQYFDFVTDASKRLVTMIDDLLRYARAGSEMQPEPVDLAPLVSDIVADLEAAAQDRGATVNVDGLPVVMGAQGPLRQVFQNLIANAIKFGPDSHCRVRVASSRAGTNHVVTVADNGPGIEPQHAKRIFAPFQRLDTSKPGTGIGLAIAARIVRQCGGRIWVDRGPEGGAVFHVSLPATGAP